MTPGTDRRPDGPRRPPMAAPLRRDDRGQMYVLEALIAGFVLLGTVLAVQGIDAPAAPASGQLAQLKATGDDALRTLDLTPPADSQAAYDHVGSTLGRYISTDDQAAMRDFLDRSLPDNARYEVVLRNASSDVVWIDGRVPAHGEVAVAHRLVAFRDDPLGLGGTVIDVQLKLWFV